MVASLPGSSTRAVGPGTTVQVWSDDTFSNDIVDNSLTAGSIFLLDILATNLPSPPVDGGINGFDITITYDSAVLKATDADNGAPLCPASEGCLFDSPSAQQVLRYVDSPQGTTRLSVVLLASTVYGSGTLFRIRFEVTGTGFTDVEIKQPDSQIVLGADPVPYKPVNGRFENRPPFMIDLVPAIAVVVAGQTVSVNVTAIQVWTIRNFTEVISFGLSGLPPNALANFSPLTGTLDFSTNLTISVPADTFGTTYPVIVTGISGFSNKRVSAILTLLVSIVDLEVTSITPSPTEVGVGNDVSVTVNVRNNGSDTQTFDINIKANSATIVTDTGISIPSQTTLPVTRTWNTGGYATGLYMISAEVPVLPGELDITNNILVQGAVRVISNFTISLNQTTATLIQGSSNTITVNADLISITPELVSLSLTGLGTGVAGTFQPTSGLPTFASTLNLTATTTAATGTFTVQVTGTSQSATRTATLTLIVKAAHDVAVTSVASSQTVVNPGQAATVSVIVRNNGANTETFTVTVTAVISTGTVTVGTVQVSSLAADQSRTVQVSWTTQGVTSGSYTLRAQITAVPGEQNTGDNTMSGSSVRINARPTVAFSPSPASPEAGTSTAFDASASTDSDGSIITYTWNFGDGTVNATGKTATHTFQNAGSYTITLTITDNDGATAIKTLTITVAQPGGGLAAFLASPLGLAVIIIAILMVLGLVVMLRRRRRTPLAAATAKQAKQAK